MLPGDSHPSSPEQNVASKVTQTETAFEVSQKNNADSKDNSTRLLKLEQESSRPGSPPRQGHPQGRTTWGHAGIGENGAKEREERARPSVCYRAESIGHGRPVRAPCRPSPAAPGPRTGTLLLPEKRKGRRQPQQAPSAGGEDILRAARWLLVPYHDKSNSHDLREKPRPSRSRSKPWPHPQQTLLPRETLLSPGFTPRAPR